MKFYEIIFNNHKDKMGILPCGAASGTTSFGIKAVTNSNTNQTGSTTTQVHANTGQSTAPNDNTRVVIKRNQ